MHTDGNLESLFLDQAMLEQFVETLYEKFKLQALPKKEQAGSYELSIESGSNITVSPLDPGLHISSIIAKVPANSRESLFMYLMRANFLGQGTGGSVIGMDSEESTLTLSLSIPYEVHYAMFEEKLEDFINFREYWRAEIEKYPENSIV
ncbi:MAG: type III secretion system chaperone [Simkaniaceae bacterium]|nr:type III secretion system chaperone [Simkaniaceae bacterium]